MVNRVFNKSKTRNTRHQFKLHNIFLILQILTILLLQHDNIVRTSISLVLFENREILPQFCLRSTCSYLVKTVTEKKHPFKTALQSGDFLKRRLIVFVDDLIQSSYRACPVRFSIVFFRLSVFLVRVKTMPIR